MPSWIARLLGAPDAAPQQNSDASQKQDPFFGIPFDTSYVYTPGQAVWMRRDYSRFANEAFSRNVIAHRAVEMIASAVASVPLKLTEQGRSNMREVFKHPLLNLLQAPNPRLDGMALTHAVMAYKLISGNAYVHAVGPKGEAPLELHLLRPDRVHIIAGEGGVPRAYQYKVGHKAVNYPVDRLTGQSRVLHLKCFHPLDDWYGLSPVEAAAYAIDQHNQAGAWNQALMQNGARPSGALVVNHKEQGGHLTEDQYYRIKQQIDAQFAGPDNAGRPILLEGGLDWKEMSLSPKDMDFIEAKHASAREIALAFGVPPQLLGIPGDNTYSNLAEARLALWEQTVMPMAREWAGALNRWLVPMFNGNLRLVPDYEDIPALSLRREALWERVKDADFLSAEEKRRLVGLE